MLSEDSIENRHEPPGVNSRSLSAVHTAADLEVLREIEHTYFSPPSEFDASRYVLENAPYPATCELIEEMFTKLKRQQQKHSTGSWGRLSEYSNVQDITALRQILPDKEVVSGKALHLISQQRDNCDKEFKEIQTIREQLSTTLNTCRDARTQLKTASNHLTVSAFVILANFRKRQIIKAILKALELLQSLRSVEKDVAELMARKEYEEAISLILNSRKAAAAHKEYTCIKDLAAKLQDILELTEEKLDSILASICYNFNEKIFCRLRRAYALLGKTQAAMEQLHMHYSSAVNEFAIEAVKPFVSENNKDLKFQELCQSVPLNNAPACLLNLCENLFLIMRSYKLLVDWHSKYDTEEITPSNATLEIENNVSREYIRQKLKAGLVRIWHDVQAKVSVFLKCTGLEEYPFEKFIQMLGILRKLMQVAEVFCGDKSDILQEFIKTHSVMYIKNYHHGRMEELKLYLENEGWELCPVKTNFTLLDLQEFKPFKKFFVPILRGEAAVFNTTTISDGTSSVHSQDASVYIAKYFSNKTNHTPFEIFRSVNVTNDDIFGLEPEAEPSDGSDDEPEELKGDYVDEEHKSLNHSPAKNNTVIVTNTTLSVLRHCGQYLQICRYLPQISLEVIMLMNQLFDYYFCTVHLFFTHDLEVASSTLYSSKLNAALKRISNVIDANVTEDDEGKIFPCPDLPQHLDLNSEANLHGLSERVVGVESVIFLAKQYKMLQPYLETIVASHQKLILEHFKENTLDICQDLRMPVFMCSASKAVDARSALIEMSQVRWDIKNVADQHSLYVDKITRQIQVFALRLENVSAKVPLNSDVLSSIWAMVSKFIVHLLVEGYSNAIKCSNGGRGLMQLDYRQLFVKLEKISGLKPIPYQDYVDRYVKAFYLPRKGLEEFVKERTEYSNKHLLALVACACENKRDRQELTTFIETKDS